VYVEIIQNIYGSPYIRGLFYMIISSVLKRYTLILLSFSLFITPWMHAESISPITPIDQIVSEGQKQLEQLAIITSTVSGMISSAPTTEPNNKKEILNHLHSLIKLIKTLQKEKFANVDFPTAHALLQFSSTITNHLETIINENFANIAHFNMEAVIKRAMIIEKSTPEEVLQSLIKNQSKINELVKKTDNFGLTWYNFVARNIYNRIINPAMKYEIPYRIGLGAATSTLGLYWWRRLHNDSYQHFTPQVVRNIFGDGPVDINPFSGERGNNQQNHPVINQIILERQNATINQLNAENERLRTQQNAPQNQPNPQERNADDAENDAQPQPQHRAHQPVPPHANALFDKIDYALSLLNRNFSPLGTALHTAVAAGWAWEFNKQYPKIKKQLSIIGNRLKGGSYLKEAQKTAEITQKVRFKDIFGQQEIKRELQILVDYLKNPEPFDRLGLTPTKGILFTGGTRSGKTFMAQALHGEIQALQEFNGSKETYKFFDLSAGVINAYGIESILRQIKQSAPCIVFIDEIHLLNVQQKTNNENSILSELLTCMNSTIDSKDPKNQVVIIAATNKPELLDIALRQPGRFGKEIRFELPNYNDRSAFLKHKLEKMSLDVETFDIDYLARSTEKRSYEALSALINNALLKARIDNEFLNQKHLNDALENDVLHIISNNSKVVPLHEQEILAAHLAAQAVALIALQPENKLSKVTIKQVMTDIKEELIEKQLSIKIKDREKNEQQRFEYGKLFLNHRKDSIRISSRSEKIKQIQVYMAGFIGEEIMHGSCGYSCHNEDAQHALALAQSIAFEGYDIADLPKHIQKIKYDHAMAIIESCKNDTRKLLLQRKSDLEIIARALLEYKTLDAQTIEKLLESPEAPVALAA
jgi:ATP-dependent Zn proteases